MIEFMDEIVDVVEGAVEWTVAGVLVALGILAKAAVLITAPVWILPYKAIRKMNEGKGRKDAGNND